MPELTLDEQQARNQAYAQTDAYKAARARHADRVARRVAGYEPATDHAQVTEQVRAAVLGEAPRAPAKAAVDLGTAPTVAVPVAVAPQDDGTVSQTAKTRKVKQSG